MTPSLNTFLEEKLKEFDEKFNKTDDNYWINADSDYSTNCVLPEDIRDFISASISEVWEINSLKKKNGIHRTK